MTDYVLFTCSTADKPREFFEQRGIEYLPFYFTMNGQEYPDDLGQTMSYKEFYQHVREGALPTTSQVSVGSYIEHWEPVLKSGRDVLQMCLSTGISGTWNSAIAAQEQLSPQYPERKIVVVDTLCASAGLGLLVDGAADLRDAGKSIEEVRDWLEANKRRVHHWFTSLDLTHLRRGGRISAASATFGTLLSICPVMNVDHMGKLIPREKVRTKKKALTALVDKMAAHAQGGLDYSGKCYISHSDCYEDARFVADLIESRFPRLNGRVEISSIGAVIGSHTGYGLVALFFWGDERVD